MVNADAGPFEGGQPIKSPALPEVSDSKEPAGLFGGGVRLKVQHAISSLSEGTQTINAWVHTALMAVGAKGLVCAMNSSVRASLPLQAGSLRCGPPLLASPWLQLLVSHVLFSRDHAE